MSKNYISSDTEEWVFSLYSHMPKEGVYKGFTGSFVPARRVYLQNEFV